VSIVANRLPISATAELSYLFMTFLICG